MGATITALLHLANQKTTAKKTTNRKQSKVDKTSNVPIMVLVIMTIGEMTSQHATASDLQNSLLFFPVLRENGIIMTLPVFG
jgi:hypothetical protein